VAKKKADLLQGTLDLLVLKTLALEPMHGWGISQRIQQISQGVLNVNQGSLYPALYRLEESGLGRLGQQPSGQVLRTHPRRAQTTGRRNKKLGAALDRRGPSAASKLAGGIHDEKQTAARFALVLVARPDGA
jgi:PadR family transcriptional regulator, regulatory protein PadR